MLDIHATEFTEADIPIGPVRSFWCALRTLFEHLATRGFPDCHPMTPTAFVRRFCEAVVDPFCGDAQLVVRPRDRLRFCVPAPAAPPYDGKPLCICFPDEAKLSIHTLGLVEAFMTENGSTRAVVLGTEGPTPSAKQVILSLYQRGASGRIIQFFREAELATNILHHELVPVHTVLSPEEERAFERLIDAKKSDCERLKRSDAVSKVLGLQRGQVVRIVRAHEAGPGATHTTYRVVE